VQFTSAADCRPYLIALVLVLAGCGEVPWNNPHPPTPEGEAVYQSVMSRPPKHLDPAISYATDESLFLAQIYEPPLGYHFLKRPSELVAAGVRELPQVSYLDAHGEVVSQGSEAVAFTRYTLDVREDAHYQPHPAFARNADGEPLYLFSDVAEASAYRSMHDFSETGSRPVLASDYAYGIKRLADPELGSPMLGMMSRYILGMEAFSDTVSEVERSGWLDLDDFSFDGLRVVDDHRLQITINGVYPQFEFWLAMQFFAPVPPEADRFYHNPGFAERNLTLDWWPVGSGPYMMVENNPNSEIVLLRNPNYRADFYPTEGAPGDAEKGLLDDAGKRLPFIDRAIFTVEKEVLPLWTKFLQGYYDRSGEVHANTTGVFDQAFVVGPDGLEMSGDIANREITMTPDVKPGIYYYGFNMRDPVVGGYSEDKRKLRQALQIAYNMEEYLAIFAKGNGIAAQTLIPPGIPGHIEGEEGINPYVYDWVDGEPRRKPIEYARQLMTEAGYPNGRDARTGEPLKIFLDVQSQAIGTTSMNWMKRTFEPLGVQVEFRPADWNRTREKLLTGNSQIYSYGWLADYPDPENFLFLLYGPESPLVCECDGSNNSNYENPEFDALFARMRLLHPGPERAKLVARMVELFRRDAVWLNAYFPKEIYLNNSWVYNTKRHGISKGTLKYLRLDPEKRAQKQAQWNDPVTWPLFAGGLLLAAMILPGVTAYRRRQNQTVR
jgi:ABC-type oligopeptide transport system substrate-binding subunit